MIGFYFFHNLIHTYFCQKEISLLFSPLRVDSRNREDFGPTKTKKKEFILHKNSTPVLLHIVIVLLCRGEVLTETKGTTREIGVPVTIPPRLLLPATTPSAPHEPRCRSHQHFCNVASLSLLNDVLFK